MLCRRDSRGFTLIEILVAILLFAVAAIAAARMQTTGIRGTTFGKEALVATTAAQALMEQLKEQAVLGNFATVLAGGGPSQVTSNPAMTVASIQAATTGTQMVSGMTIQWAASNTTAGAQANSRYTTVTVTVLWAGNTRSYVTRTIISERQ